jgi:hypothetical protein
MTTDTITVKTTEPNTFDRTVADLKQGVEYSTKAHAEASEKTIKAAKDFVAFNQASLEAVTQASKIVATEARDLSRQAVASNQAAFDEVLSGFRALVAAKSIKENIELQASLTRAAATWTVSEGTRLAQASIALVEKASAPLIACATAGAETFSALKA